MSKRRIFILLFFLTAFLLTNSTVFAATLSLSPSSGSYNVGKLFNVNIMLNTNGANTDGVDIYYLNYPKNLLQVQGTQITAGSLYPITVVNSVDSVNGRINFSQVVSGGTHYSNTSAQTLATVNFKVLATGTASLFFNYSSSSTTDCNVAGNGIDLLTSATGASFSTYKAADLNKDGYVNSVDFGILMTYWGTTSSTADINGDGAVNSVDLGIMMTQWGT